MDEQPRPPSMYEWSAGPRPAMVPQRAVFTRHADGSLQIGVRGGEGAVTVLMAAEDVPGLARWMATLIEDPAPVPQPLIEDDLTLADGESVGSFGEFVNAGSQHVCPGCGWPTTYQVFSGGREWYCTNCGADGDYPDGRAPSRAGLLTTPEGREALREQMAAELARRKADGAVQEGE